MANWAVITYPVFFEDKANFVRFEMVFLLCVMGWITYKHTHMIWSVASYSLRASEEKQKPRMELNFAHNYLTVVHALVPLLKRHRFFGANELTVAKSFPRKNISPRCCQKNYNGRLCLPLTVDTPKSWLSPLFEICENIFHLTTSPQNFSHFPKNSFMVNFFRSPLCESNKCI